MGGFLAVVQDVAAFCTILDAVTRRNLRELLLDRDCLISKRGCARRFALFCLDKMVVNVRRHLAAGTPHEVSRLFERFSGEDHLFRTFFPSMRGKERS